MAHQLADEAHEPTQHVLSYFLFQSELPSVFTPDEQSHLFDVRAVLWICFFVLLLCAFFLLRSFTKQTIRDGGILLAILIALLFVIPFDIVFTWFHYAAFPQGNWMFSPDSMLITLYPFEFFATFFGITLAYSLLCYLLLYYIAR